MDASILGINFIQFLGTKYGIILTLSIFTLFGAILIIVYKWSNIGPFFMKLIDSTSTLSSTRWVMIVQVIISNVFVWGLWAVMTICDNMDKTPDMAFTLVDIPGGVLTAYGIANGVASVTKLGQAFADAKKEK